MLSKATLLCPEVESMQQLLFHLGVRGVRMRKATIAKLLVVCPSVRLPAGNNRAAAGLGILHLGFVLTSVEKI